MPSESILGLDLADLGGLLGPGQPAYRARQIYQAVYQAGATDFGQITSLPAGLRRELAAQHRVGLPSIAHVYRSTDGTLRYLLELDDGRTVETVLMPEEGRDTICI